ncbi:MAG TPA: homoserine dehydrogenase [Nitrososphaeria archaeon]|nr:homoserine dehydrogenase [Nitrososphaeria archaeon]
MIRCVILGYGFLGRRLAKELALNGVEGVKLVGIASSKGHIYREKGFKPGELPEDITRASDFREGSSLELVDGRLADLLVELTPTNIRDGEPGLSHIRRALEEGMDVVTANKGPMALAYEELTGLAEERGVMLLYEATVGGGMPLISLQKRCLMADELLEIRGILNGTTNYILSRMHFEGMTFDLALREAQMLGIAERDPSLDINGIDTALKIVILANSLMNARRKLSDVKVKGIRKVTSEAVAAAKESGMAIKLIGTASEEELSVAPRLIKLGDPLCIHGTLNAVNFKLRILGNLTIIGEGAGESTVSALLNDIREVARARSG